MRWLSFIRDGAPTFGYLTSDGAGVVDVGARGKFADLKSAIAADAPVLSSSSSVLSTVNSQEWNE